MIGDEKALKSKKARLTKEIELKKHIHTVNNLKKKIAKQIVNKTLNLEEFKKLDLDDIL